MSFCGSDIPLVEGIISVAHDDSVFVRETGKRLALALRTDLQHLTPKKDVILNACACKETDIKNEQPDGNLKIFILENVLNNYDMRVGETIWVKKTNPIPLERILVAISSEERYLWAKKFLASFLRDCLSTGPLTVRENDVLCFPNGRRKTLTNDKEDQWSQFTVLQCEPVQQGCITLDTSVVVSKVTEPEICLESESSGANSEVIPSDSSEIFLVSDFARSLCGNLLQEKSLGLSHGGMFGGSNELQVSVLHWDKVSDADLTCDASSRLHVSLATLIDLCLFNGSWVKICTNHTKTVCDCSKATSNEEDACDSSCCIGECRVVQIVAFASEPEYNDYMTSNDIIRVTNHNDIEDGVAYITPLLYFNIFHKNTSHDSSRSIYIHPLTDKSQIKADLSTASKSGKPPFAKEAHVSLVHSPHYKAGDSFDLVLLSHFKVARVLTVGDVFYVYHNWQEDSDAKESSTGDDQGKRNLVVYFQVTRLVCEDGETKSCFVDIEHSSLYQVSALLLFTHACIYSNQWLNLHLHDIYSCTWL